MIDIAGGKNMGSPSLISQTLHKQGSSRSKHFASRWKQRDLDVMRRNQRIVKGWWLSGCHSSVAEHWRLKPEVSWGSTPDPFHSIFCLITSKFLLLRFQLLTSIVRCDQISIMLTSAKYIVIRLLFHDKYSLKNLTGHTDTSWIRVVILLSMVVIA